MGILPSLLESGYALRDRLLANARFQRRVAALPLLRGVARRRAGALFDLCAGFVYSQVLYACVRLGLFERLKDGPRPLTDLAAVLGVHPEALRSLLSAAAALDLVQWRGGEGACGLGSAGATLLGIAGLQSMIAHHALLYADLAEPLALLKDRAPATRLSQYWSYARTGQTELPDAAAVEGYTALMAQTQQFIAAEVLDACDLSGHRVLLDVGGGDGTFALRAAQRLPGLRVVCFDLPAVAARAAARFEHAGLGARARAVGGSFLTDALPRGADVASLVRVLHDHDDAAVLRILRAVRAALPADGVLIVAEPLSGTPGGARVADAYFGMYLLAMGSGRPRRLEELAALLKTAGFGAPHAHATRFPSQLRVLSAACGAAAEC